MTERAKAISVLAANTVAFAVCFAVWMMNGVLVTFLVDSGAYPLSSIEIGWLLGAPVLTGSLLRLPVGLLTDRFGGRLVFTGLLLCTAGATYLYSYADGFWSMLAGSLGFGMAGAAFAVGIAYTSLWFPRHRQGLALGVFGAGNAGGALTAMVGPALLGTLTDGGARLDGWRQFPRLYAAGLAVTAILFWLCTHPRVVADAGTRTLVQRLAPLGSPRVWRFGLYYFLVFGGFVALAQWLIPYYVNTYAVSVAVAGLLSAIFTLPSGVIRALGGWLSDHFGARRVMYWVLGGCIACCALLLVPRMDIVTPGRGVMATRAGEVTAVSADEIVVAGVRHRLEPMPAEGPEREGQLILPTLASGQQPVVAVGDLVAKKQLLARGDSRLYFQANIWVFTLLVFAVGILMGIGKAAVYKHIPEYFPNDVGTVGGVVGVIGGLGGFVGAIVFGGLLDWTGLWTSCWLFLLLLAVASLLWMHRVVRRMTAARAPEIARAIEDNGSAPLALRVHCPVHGVEADVRIVVRPGAVPGARAIGCSLTQAGQAACEAHCVAVPPARGG